MLWDYPVCGGRDGNLELVKDRTWRLLSTDETGDRIDNESFQGSESQQGMV